MDYIVTVCQVLYVPSLCFRLFKAVFRDDVKGYEDSNE